MSRAMLKNLTQAFPIPFRTSSTPRITVIGETGTQPVSLRQILPDGIVPRRGPTPIVHLPVEENRNAARPQTVATADLKVKQFRGHRVEEERYTATLHAASDAPAALLAALTDTAREIEELGCQSAPDEQLVMHITIRRK